MHMVNTPVSRALAFAFVFTAVTVGGSIGNGDEPAVTIGLALTILGVSGFVVLVYLLTRRDRR